MLNWEPKSQMQLDVLESPADIVCAGGCAGSYKSETLLVDAVQEYDNPNFHGILFRETFPELTRSLIPRAHALYSQLGATYNSQEHAFHWPWGSVMRFAYMGRDEDVYPHQSAQYTWIGADESTHQVEFRLRYMLSRMRSIDPSLHCRMRFATNPGGQGHALHQHVFLGNKCPHCEKGGREANKIYTDATWLSDKKPIGFTTQYIFGKWDPKGLLPDYGKALDTQGGATGKALKEGCWRAFEGQYFDIWEPNRASGPMVVSRQSVKDDWWWTSWTGSDYGFSGSAAFSVKAMRSPDGGPIVLIDEYPRDLSDARRLDIKAFARGHYEALIKKPLRYEQPPRLAAMYLSPDAWNERGDMHTLAGLADEELSRYELSFIRAQNDRAGAAMLIYTMLQTGELVIADTCVNVMSAIESRIHDKKEPEKVEKILGDPLDDVWDAVRYCIYSYHEAERKPTEMRIEERVKAALEINPTRAAVEYQKIRREEESEDEPAIYGGNARSRFQELARRRGRQ